MVTPLRYNPKNELANSFISSNWQSAGHLDTHTYLNPEDAYEQLRMKDERLQEWRIAMFKIRNVESEIGLH
ncbi:MAG: hypothetical protein NTW57_06510 [Methylophilales bacterium]|nr:hypothetical protein [Methylophilales bacterium]